MASTLKFCTWNVNSARARLKRILAFLTAHKPDIVCLQEIKSTHDTFPFDTLRDAGYEAVICGQPTYNGVALLTKEVVQNVRTGLDNEARVIAGTVHDVRVVNVYVPNGQKIGTPKHAYKLRWLNELSTFLAEEKKEHAEFILTGDFNVAPGDLDVAHPDAWEGTVLCDPEARERLANLIEQFRLVDVLRVHVPGPGVYTWWDYRSRGFEWNDGVRIDHILATPSLARRCVHAWVDIEERGRERPSDHAPVLTRLLAG